MILSREEYIKTLDTFLCSEGIESEIAYEKLTEHDKEMRETTSEIYIWAISEFHQDIKLRQLVLEYIKEKTNFKEGT